MERLGSVVVGAVVVSAAVVVLTFVVVLAVMVMVAGWIVGPMTRGGDAGASECHRHDECCRCCDSLEHFYLLVDELSRGPSRGATLDPVLRGSGWSGSSSWEGG
jgi:hypothetical protein